MAVCEGATWVIDGSNSASKAVRSAVISCECCSHEWSLSTTLFMCHQHQQPTVSVSAWWPVTSDIPHRRPSTSKLACTSRLSEQLCRLQLYTSMQLHTVCSLSSSCASSLYFTCRSKFSSWSSHHTFAMSLLHAVICNSSPLFLLSPDKPISRSASWRFGAPGDEDYYAILIIIVCKGKW